MKIECEENPSDLIEKIGGPNFSICDHACDELLRHKNHPRCLRIIDYEHSVYIDVTGETVADTLMVAKALCKLLNQDYRKA